MPRPKAVTSKMILELVEHQRFRCALSGRKLTPETASLDHIVPLSRGGEHNLSNLWVLDHQVNMAKGTLMVDDFVAMCREVTQQQDGHTGSQVAIGTSGDI